MAVARLFFAWVVFLSTAAAFAQAGPPMVTDDPGTPGDGHWEINIYGRSAFSDEIYVAQLPYVDLNYGYGERTQLKAEGGWVSRGSSLSPNQSGFTTLMLGVKYRYLDEETAGIAASIYPQYQFHHAFSSQDPELNEPGDQWTIPFEFAKTLGAFVLVPDIGYVREAGNGEELFYGLLLAYERAKPYEPLVELHANRHLDGSGTSLLFSVGLRAAVDPRTAVIVSLGRSIVQVGDDSPELDLLLGAQLEL